MSASPEDDKKSPKKTNSICQVCGDNASIINYGVLTCPSCRTFFRRNGFNIKEFSVCRYDGHCEITQATRKSCTVCRLTKCLTVGMSPELIRKEELTRSKRKSDNQEVNEYRTITTISQTSVLNTSRDGFSLTTTELVTISNINHAFDVFSPITDIRRMIETINTSASNSRFDLKLTYEMLSAFSNCLLLFISSTPDFKVLTTSEQWSLLQRNMFGLLSYGGMYLMRESGIFDKPENEMAVLPLYGIDIIQQARIISTQFDCDSTLIKLMLIVLAFSSNCFTKTNRTSSDKDSLLYGTFRLFGSQNVYVELLWKYLSYQCDDYQAVQRFSKLIKQFLDTFKLSCDIYQSNETYQKFVDNILEQAEKSAVINEKTIIPLWGKN
ncbi:hypothetical protein I4U23_001649 [Adineta vaga]|nr:hypothetical protein I4U23_001649 [Adineta vaga]